MAPFAVGLVALFIPLLRDFHIESAILAATIGAYWGGIAAVKAGPGMDLRCAIQINGFLYLAGLPLALFSVLTGCFTVHGLGFWVFLPLPSVFLGYSIGRLSRQFRVPFPRFFTVVVLLLITFGGFLYEFFTLPQLYFYNHVWGYWPGPIYDEAIQFPLSLVAFRFLTLCWILVIWLVPMLDEDRFYRWILGLAVLGLLTGYMQLEKTRIITPKETLQQRLGGQLETDHTRIYYAEQAISDQEIDRMATEIEFYIHQIQHSLGIDKPDSSQKIELYLYAHPWQKKELVGAKYTSYVTVWQQVPQVHIAKTQVDGSLKHEVVHAVTALLPWPGLVPNIGLTEGIAVALNPDRSPRSTIDQLVAAHKPYPTAEQMSSSLSYWGFYTNRSAVSYTTTGSFVRYLIDEKSPQEFLDAYRCGSIELGYSESFSVLVEGWHQRLDSVRIDSSDRERASEIFGRLSIFEQQCPHKVPRAAELFDQYLLYEILNDTTRVISTLAALKEIDPEERSPQLLWMLWNLRAGHTDPVIAQADPNATRIEYQLLTADAHRMATNYTEAREYLNQAVSLAAQQSDTTFDEAFAVRLDSLQWSYDLRLRYENIVLQPGEFDLAYYRLKIRALQNVLDLDADNNLLESYANRLLKLPLDLEYFDTYLSLIHRLAYEGSIELSQMWIKKLSEEVLSLRYQERLAQQRAWIVYLDGKDEM
ncbi:hypothetical protein [Aliifodinibius sp. S!AR15-10]|uniref:hypothetical protein n=1 Tax=Aliifodinibius sp. S!AR15-10 TaxID=2950437 RepID=UPI0028704BD5|nr:hypothetical protein [Aliifodinibius sp. S!AR15-10]